MPDLQLPATDDELLALAFPQGPVGDRAGLFDDDAPIRRLSRENAVVMGGGCALLLEVAHPLVAAGVGLPYVVAQKAGWNLGDIRSQSYEYGNTFTLVAGLLNLLIVLDAYDVATGRR